MLNLNSSMGYNSKFCSLFKTKNSYQKHFKEIDKTLSINEVFLKKQYCQ